jgi:hypothetical protein
LPSILSRDWACRTFTVLRGPDLTFESALLGNAEGPYSAVVATQTHGAESKIVQVWAGFEETASPSRRAIGFADEGRLRCCALAMSHGLVSCLDGPAYCAQRAVIAIAAGKCRSSASLLVPCVRGVKGDGSKHVRSTLIVFIYALLCFQHPIISGIPCPVASSMTSGL